MDRHHARSRFAALRSLDIEREAVFVGGPVDPDLVADHQRRQQRERAEPFENHLVPVVPPYRITLAYRAQQRQTRRVFSCLIPAAFWRKTAGAHDSREGTNVTGPADNRLQARNDLAWAISVGGIGVVTFAALLA